MHLVTACIKNAPKDENDQDWNGHDVWILGSECCNDLCWPLCNVEITAPRCSIIIHSMFGSLWCFSRSIYGSGSSICKVNFRIGWEKMQETGMSCGMQKPPFPVGFPWNQWFPWSGLPIAAAHLHQPAHVAGLHSHAEHREQLSSTLASGRRRKIWNLPGDFVRFTNKYRKICKILPIFVGDEWVGPCWP